MILHGNIEQVMAMCRVQKWQLSLSYFSDLFPLDCFRRNFVSVPELEYPMLYYYDTLQFS